MNQASDRQVSSVVSTKGISRIQIAHAGYLHVQHEVQHEVQ